MIGLGVFTFLTLGYFLLPFGRRGNAVFLFVLMVPFRGIVPANQELLGFIDHQLFSAMLLIFNSKVNPLAQKEIKKKEMDTTKKLAINLALLLLVIVPFYIELKSFLWDPEYSTTHLVKTTLKNIILFVATIQVVRHITSSQGIEVIEKAFTLNIVIGILSMIFFKFFLGLGFNIETGIGDSNARLTGFYVVNANDAAMYFNIGLAFYLGIADSNKSVFKNIIGITLCFLGLMIVASKTGLAVASGLSLLFLYRNKNILNVRNLASIVILMVVAVASFNLYGDLMKQRIEAQLSGEHDTFQGRVGHWEEYFGELEKQPIAYLVGNVKELKYDRSAHNLFVMYFAEMGVLFLIPLFIILLKIFRRLKDYTKVNPSYPVIYIFIAINLHWLTNVPPYNPWITFVIAFSSGYAIYTAKEEAPPVRKTKKLQYPYYSG